MLIYKDLGAFGTFENQFFLIKLQFQFRLFSDTLHRIINCNIFGRAAVKNLAFGIPFGTQMNPYWPQIAQVVPERSKKASRALTFWNHRTEPSPRSSSERSPAQLNFGWNLDENAWVSAN